MLISRAELRLAVAAGLSNGFAAMTGLAYGFYSPLAVVSVGTGSYGGAIELGRQRLLGTVLGSVLLLVGYWGLRDVPMPIAIAITLAALRLLGGWLKLLVGYKVGGLIVVMGWLSHSANLGTWIPLRFFWTAFGVLVGLLSLRLFWPTRSLDTVLRQYGELFSDLRRTYQDLAQRLLNSEAQGPGIEDYKRLRARLISLRALRPALSVELGEGASRHPSVQLVQCLDDACSRLVMMVGGMVRRAPTLNDSALIERLHQGEAALLQVLGQRLEQWEQRFSGRRRTLPQPPSSALALPQAWLDLNRELADPNLNRIPLERLERIAARLLLCRQAEQAMQDAERTWSSVLPR
jgi:uncharacterized membrane protein YccC